MSIENGGVVLHGSLQLLHNQPNKKEAESESSVADSKFGSEAGEPARPGLAAFKKQQRKKRETLKLGQSFKLHETQGFNDPRLEAIQFVIPDDEEYVAFDSEYTAFLHFAPVFVDDLRRGRITNEKVRDAVNYARNLKRHKELHVDSNAIG